MSRVTRQGNARRMRANPIGAPPAQALPGGAQRSRKRELIAWLGLPPDATEQDIDTERQQLVQTLLDKDANLYDRFAVPPTSSEQELTEAYKNWALLLHTDRQRATDHDAFAVMSGIAEILRDPAERHKYDENTYFETRLPESLRKQPRTGNFFVDPYTVLTDEAFGSPDFPFDHQVPRERWVRQQYARAKQAAAAPAAAPAPPAFDPTRPAATAGGPFTAAPGAPNPQQGFMFPAPGGVQSPRTAAQRSPQNVPPPAARVKFPSPIRVAQPASPARAAPAPSPARVVQPPPSATTSGTSGRGAVEPAIPVRWDTPPIVESPVKTSLPGEQRGSFHLTLEELMKFTRLTLPHTRVQVDERGRTTSQIFVLTIEVAPGTPDNTSYRFKGLGNTPGTDLVLFFSAAEHPTFSRNGHDLYLKAPRKFSIWRSLLQRSTSTVLGLDENDYFIDIHGAVRANTQYIARGGGLPVFGREGSRGNIVVRFELFLPDEMTPEQEEVERLLASALPR